MKKLTLRVVLVVSIAAVVATLVLASGGDGETPATGGRDLRDPAVLARTIETQDIEYLLVDVRTPAEYGAGFIPTAINVDYREIVEGLSDVPRDDLVIVYCRTGNRSGQALRSLQGAGFTNVVDFGGINRWPGVLHTP